MMKYRLTAFFIMLMAVITVAVAQDYDYLDYELQCDEDDLMTVYNSSYDYLGRFEDMYDLSPQRSLRELYITGSLWRDWSLYCGYSGAISSPDSEENLSLGEEIYTYGCAGCHGDEGYGVPSIAPAIRNPLLYGIEPITSQTIRLNEIDLYLNTQLRREKGGLELFDDLPDEQQARLDELWKEEAIYEEERSGLLDAREQFIEEFSFYINDVNELAFLFGDLSLATDSSTDEYENFSKYIYRLNEVSWLGNLESYLYAKIGFGIKSEIYSEYINDNHSFSIRTGSYLTDTQIGSLIDYLMTWDKNWTLEDLDKVRQFPIPTVPYYLVPEEETIEAVGTSNNLVDEILAQLGDKENGGRLFNGVMLACSACHQNGAVATATEDIWSITVNERLKEDQLQGYTVERYIIESIVIPSNYVVDGYPDVHPDYITRISQQDIIDIISYLKDVGTSE